MPRFKYPAPYDVEDPPLRHDEVVGAPLPPCPPLIVNVPGDKSVNKSPSRHRSLYLDTFGTDLSVLAEALHASWATPEHQELAAQILSGRKPIHSLSTPDEEMLDDITIQYEDHGGAHEHVPAADSERLPVLDEVESGQEDSEGLYPAGPSDLQSDLPSSITDAFNWTKKGR